MKIDQGNNMGTRSKSTKTKPNAVLIAVIAVIAVVLIIAGIFIVKNLTSGRKDTPVSEPTTSSDVSASESSDVTSSDISDVSEEEFKEEDIFDPETGILEKFSEQHKATPELLGHLTIPGTLLDVDVAQHKGDSNNSWFYLNHRLDGTVDPYGTPFLDPRATMGFGGQQSPVCTIHGHNSKNGDYFESIKSYKDIEYYKANPLVEFDTIYGSGMYKIIGYATIYVEFENPDPKEEAASPLWRYHDVYDVDEEGFNEYLKQLDMRNFYDTDIDVKFGDKIIALSTCNDDLHVPLNTPYRDVLFARKVRDGESTDVDVSKIVLNKDGLKSSAWTAKYGKVQ